MPNVNEIADAIVEALEAETFSLECTVERAYIPHYEPEDLQGLTVTIVPKERLKENQARTTSSDKPAVDIAIQQKVDDTTPDVLDPLFAFACEIEAFLERKRMAGASWVRSIHPFIYSPDHLRQKRIFTSVITVTYKAA